MAAMSIVNNAILTLSKSSSAMGQSIPFRPRVSRVCFTSASRSYQQGRNAADESVGEPRDEVRETMDRAQEKTRQMMDRAKETAEETSDAAKEKAETAADKTKAAAEKVADAAKQTVQGACGAAKETTHKIKETVVGKSDDDDNLDDYIEDHVRKPATNHKDKVMDKDVMDARRRRVEEHDQNKL